MIEEIKPPPFCLSLQPPSITQIMSQQMTSSPYISAEYNYQNAFPFALGVHCLHKNEKN